MFHCRKAITLALTIMVIMTISYAAITIVAATPSCTLTSEKPFLVCSVRESSETQEYSLNTNEEKIITLIKPVQ
jgi:hypothetical protein